MFCFTARNNFPDYILSYHSTYKYFDFYYYIPFSTQELETLHELLEKRQPSAESQWNTLVSTITGDSATRSQLEFGDYAVGETDTVESVAYALKALSDLCSALHSPRKFVRKWFVTQIHMTMLAERKTHLLLVPPQFMRKL